MCGIWVTIGEPLGRLPLSLLAHRGPDGEGFSICEVSGTTIELGHRRLAIIDLDRRSDQPMATPDGRYVIVYNGELYNFLELRNELVSQGVEFRTQSDTEVLLAAWVTWGESALSRFVGMFAFIILDRIKGEIVVGRDPFGIKPLYYASTRRGLALASEIAPLLECPGVTREGDVRAAYKFAISGQTDGTHRTLFRDVRVFPAAHVCRVAVGERGPLQFRRYWQPGAQKVNVSSQDAPAQVRSIFLDSIRLHLRSDVPLGAALSGGIDSSAIVAAMRSVGGPSLDIHAFSFIAPGNGVDESQWIRSAASAAGAASHTVEASPAELLMDVDRLIKLQGEPFGSTSIYAQYRVMDLASDYGIKVMLDGQGSDELFAGYRPYLANRVADLVRQNRPLEAIAFMFAAARLPGTQLSQIAIQSLGALSPSFLIPLGRQLIGKSLSPDWLDREWLSARDAEWHVTEVRNGRSLQDRLMESLTLTVLPALLRYEDRNSMHFSIESRVPFLTTALADFAYSCPAELLISKEGVTKSVFRSAMRGLVPDAILDRRDKIGFATPEFQWLQTLRPWAKSVLCSQSIERLPFLKRDVILNSFNDMIEGRRALDFQAWRWLNLIRWAEVFDVRFS